MVAEGLKKIITDINKLAELPKTLPRSVSWLSLEIEDEHSTSFLEYYHLDFELLRTYFRLRFMDPEFVEVRTSLEEIGFFNAERRYNPQLTYFGAIVANYFSLITEYAEETEFASRFPVTFDEEVFQTCWDGILPWVADAAITFKAYYLIFGTHFEGNSFPYEADPKLTFVVPDFNKRMELANSLKIPIYPLEGMGSAMNRALCFVHCGAWIEGELELSLKEFSTAKHSVPFDLPHPSFIEEAFALLGCSSIKVECLIFNQNLHYEAIALHPVISGGASWSRGGRQFPNWMDQYGFSFPIKESFKLTESNTRFLQTYPKMRKNLPLDSIEALTITRFLRAARSRLFNDSLLEIVIALESLMTHGSTDASLQFRLNISWLLGKSPEDRRLLEYICNQLYSIRSKIVHAGGLLNKLNKHIKKLGGVQATKDIALEILRLLIFRLIIFEDKSMHFIARSVLETEFPKLRLGIAFNQPINVYYDLFYKEALEKIVQRLPAETRESLK